MSTDVRGRFPFRSGPFATIAKALVEELLLVYERARKYRVPKVRTGDLRFIDSNLTLLMGRLVQNHSIKSRKFGWIKSFVSLIQICRS